MIARSHNLCRTRRPNLQLSVGHCQSVANAIAIRQAAQKYGCKKVITFHDYVASAQEFANNTVAQTEVGMPIWHVNGAMPSGERFEIMSAFSASPIGVVTNARCLTEGVDLPAVDMVAFLSPKKAPVDIIQAIGRALRLHPGKQTGYMLLPLYVNQLNQDNLERALHESGYDRIWSVIEALREHDDVVKTAITDATVSSGKGVVTPGASGFGFIEMSGPAIHLDWLRAVIDIQCIEAIGSALDSLIGMLEAFAVEYGHVDVPQSYVVDGENLGRRCNALRESYRKGLLSEESVQRLEAIGFRWFPLADRFERVCAQVEQYATVHGHADVPSSYVVDGENLGRQCGTLRKSYRKGNLSEERVRRLEAIGFRWSPLDDDFERTFALLEQYATVNGHADVPSSYIVDGENLGWRCGTLRKSYRKGNLSEERVRRLEAIGFRWSLLSGRFERTCALLEQYAAAHGHADVQRWYVIDGEKLGEWCHTLRKSYRKGNLSEERVRRLEAIGFRWSPLDDDFERIYALLEQYATVNGHADVPSSYIVDGENLGWRCNALRQSYRKGTLSEERVRRLQAIGFRFARRRRRLTATDGCDHTSDSSTDSECDATVATETP
ncbi:helicase associated domain-containing protein [Burkholderia contaminans]|uniref:Helicase C-terminal domain-containing protein n=1 Tax=Burkholderia contaminans TaxID=488447 RepID=A0A2S5DMB0_9BURK|nr:helicase associated domain-containing protein [Burkholderia contaminans]POZ80220.1 hypothetical protein C3743_40295 [Burkholderia contaminans]